MTAEQNRNLQGTLPGLISFEANSVSDLHCRYKSVKHTRRTMTQYKRTAEEEARPSRNRARLVLLEEGNVCLVSGVRPNQC